MGPENLTLIETASILSQVLGYSVEYERVRIESLQQQFAAMGATADVQREMGDLFRALGDPDGVYATARTLDANTPTTFEQFVKYKREQCEKVGLAKERSPYYFFNSLQQCC
jgi:hypothetical protein